MGAFLLAKKEKKIFATFLFCASVFLFVSPYFILPQIYAGRGNWTDTAPPNAALLELWEIDTFEGGSASRAKFLERRAYAFQKDTFSSYVFVRSLSLSQAKTMLSGGAKPDLVSFGIGAGELLEPFCVPLSVETSVRSDLLQCGIVNGNVLAIPWCVGGYCLCADSGLGGFELNARNEFSIGTGGVYNVANLALPKELNKIASTYTQFEAYEAYLRGEFDILLGTQRDFYRLNKKVESGVIGPVNYTYLSAYTDLIQVISVCSNDNKAVAEKFIEYLLTPTSQACLVDIGLFSVINVSIYNDIYKDFENSIIQPKTTLNVFTKNENIKSLQGGGNG